MILETIIVRSCVFASVQTVDTQAKREVRPNLLWQNRDFLKSIDEHCGSGAQAGSLSLPNLRLWVCNSYQTRIWGSILIYVIFLKFEVLWCPGHRGGTSVCLSYCHIIVPSICKGALGLIFLHFLLVLCPELYHMAGSLGENSDPEDLEVASHTPTLLCAPGSQALCSHHA